MPPDTCTYCASSEGTKLNLTSNLKTNKISQKVGLVRSARGLSKRVSDPVDFISVLCTALRLNKPLVRSYFRFSINSYTVTIPMMRKVGSYAEILWTVL